MSDKILFRGKRADNGNWIKGGYARDEWTNWVYITLWNTYGLGFLDYIRIVPETLGQYSGIPDKDGNDIFSGDLLIGPDGIVYKVVFVGGCFKISDIEHPNGNLHLLEEISGWCEIIGTIYDKEQ